MAINIGVRVDIGDARLPLRYLQNLGEHPRPLLEIAGSLLEESTRDRFRTGHGPGGVPWPPSGRQVYAARPGGRSRKGEGKRSKMGPNRGSRTLVDKGGLLASITHVADDKRVEWGVIAKTPSAKFAYVHQFGATITPKRGEFLVFRGPDGALIFARKVEIPARPFIGVDETDRAVIRDAWLDYVRSRLGVY